MLDYCRFCYWTAEMILKEARRPYLLALGLAPLLLVYSPCLLVGWLAGGGDALLRKERHAP